MSYKNIYSIAMYRYAIIEGEYGYTKRYRNVKRFFDLIRFRLKLKSKMDIKYLEPEIENYNYLKLQYKEFIIYTEVTVMGETILGCFNPNGYRSEFFSWWVGKENLTLFLLGMIWGIINAIDEKLDFKELRYFNKRPVWKDQDFNVWLLKINGRHEASIDQKWIDYIALAINVAVETELPKIKIIRSS